MIDTILAFWHNLPLVIRVPLDFCFTVVFVRGILAKEIMDFFKERGLFKEGIIHATIHFLKRYIPSLERKLAIWTHYSHHHPAVSVLECPKETCGVLHA